MNTAAPYYSCIQARATDEIPSRKLMAEDAGFGASALDEKIYNSLAELDKEEATVGTPGSIPNTPSTNKQKNRRAQGCRKLRARRSLRVLGISSPT